MIDAVFYEPATPGATSGRIIATISATRDTIAGDGRPFVIVDHYSWDYDATHKVVEGAVVPMEDGNA